MQTSNTTAQALYDVATAVAVAVASGALVADRVALTAGLAFGGAVVVGALKVFARLGP